ncbi:MAG: hypothetical protein O7B26_11250, partial [Planctomycetota bacterium]|nr:hypothetical protein [Planctomycetota bacterium]
MLRETSGYAASSGSHAGLEATEYFMFYGRSNPMSRIVSRGAVGLVTCICICWAVTTAVGDSSREISANDAPKQGSQAQPATPTPGIPHIEAGPSFSSFRTTAGLPLSTSDLNLVPVGGPAPRGVCGGGTDISELADINTVTQVNSVFCPGPGTQSYARCFETTLFPAGGNLVFDIDCVRFGVQTDLNDVPYNLTIKLTLTPANGPDCSAVVGELPAAWVADHTQL